MGASFFSVLEYAEYDLYTAFGRINIPRDYKLFSAIALGDGGLTDNPIYPPRGLPPDCSFDAFDLFFTEPEVVKEYISTSTSESEEEMSLEEYVKGFGKWAIKEYKENGYLLAPETYDHSWLNLNELKEAMAHQGLNLERMSMGFKAMMSAMEVLAKEYGPEKVRLVFCFGM